jgi:MFS superfamily sulfate permease-like transporter
MLFGIYLGTTIYAWRTLFRYVKEFRERLDEEGYELVKKKHSIFEYIFAAIMVSLPVVNLIYPFFFGDVNRTYNEIKLKMIKDGSICLKDSDINYVEAKAQSKDEIMEEVVRLREEVNALRNEKNKQNTYNGADERRLYPLMRQTYTSTDESFEKGKQKIYRK